MTAFSPRATFARLRGLLPAPTPIDRDAIAFQSDVAAIEAAPPPWGARATLHVVLMFFTMALLWAGFAQMDRVVIAEGHLVSTRPMMMIQPRARGIVHSLEVSFGAVVAKGQLLATLEPAPGEGGLVELRAPAEGVVQEVNERALGALVQPGDVLLTLVPKGVPLEVEIAIPGDSIASIRPGDLARIKLEAFPFQRHGTLDGRIRVISETPVRPDGGAAEAPAAFRARLTMAAPVLREVPGDFRLLPGMALSAEITIGRRTVLSYFLYPVLRVFDESLRDG
jgi:multidrug efflux pump subunit AcrA (membrane-fusion protein)